MKLEQFPHKPGIYQMYNEAGKLLYVGKARDLRKRISSYFQKQNLATKTQVLMRQVESIETIITASDTEALLLEANLIKKHRPRYNVLLRDDKSYPYLYLDTEQIFPRLDFYRGSRKKPGRYFGPYPSAGAVRENLALLQKLFLVRQCRDSFFKHRSRPCLQYQIKRCTAPCVGNVSENEYAEQVRHTLLFLEGKNSEIINRLSQRMQAASDEREYELAKQYRDQISQLQKLQETQCITGDAVNIDVIAVAMANYVASVSVLSIRQGRVVGQRIYFPSVGIAEDTGKVLDGFITQYYLTQRLQEDPLEKIILSDKVVDRLGLENALQDHCGYAIQLSDFRGARYRQWQAMAKTNAQHALANHHAEKQSVADKLLALRHALGLVDDVERIECFDISHTMGDATVASCVVYDYSGANRKDYRRYNIKSTDTGDDYAAMTEVLQRRYTKLKLENQVLPDIVLIDGGQGQLNKAIAVFEELQITSVQLVGVSKGPARKPGQEQLWLPGRARPLQLGADSSALHLIQFVRDEAHRFAITTHRQRRAKEQMHSSLEDIPGIGAKRRRDLLNFFGGMQALRDASIIEIAKVSGISKKIAQKIYDFFH